MSHIFEFQNTTDRTQQILWMEKTCACAKAWLVFKGKEIDYSEVVRNPIEVPSKARGQIKIELDLHGIKGKEFGEATIGTTDPHHKAMKCRVDVKVKPHFLVDPPNINLGKVLERTPILFSFTVTNNHQEPWKITDLAHPNDIQDLTTSPLGNTLGYRFEGNLVPGSRMGGNGGVIKVKTDFQNKTVEVPVIAEFVPPFTIEPKSLNFGMVNRKKGKTAELTIKNNTNKPLALKSAYFENMTKATRYFKVTPLTGEIKKELKLTIKLLPMRKPGKLKGNLVLLLQPTKPTKVIIPLNAYIK